MALKSVVGAAALASTNEPNGPEKVLPWVAVTMSPGVAVRVASLTMARPLTVVVAPVEVLVIVTTSG